MNLSAIIFVACIACSFARSVVEKQNSKIREFEAACIAEVGANPAAVGSSGKSNVNEGDAKSSCVTACVMKKIGIIDANGAFNEAALQALIPAGVPKDRVDAIVNKCKLQTGANACETAAKLYKCYMENKTVSLFE